MSVSSILHKFTLVIALLVTSISANAAITIRAPDIAENGAVVPVSANFDTPLQSGQTLNIYANGQLACAVKPKSFALTSFSTRVRMQSSGEVLMQVVDSTGKALDSSSKSIRVTIGASIPTNGNSDAKVRTRAQGNSVKALFMNTMAINGHISWIEVNTSAGSLSIQTTAQMSQNPYIGLTATQDLGSVNISTNIGSGSAPSAPAVTSSAPPATPSSSAPTTINAPVSGYGGSGAY